MSNSYPIYNFIFDFNVYIDNFSLIIDKELNFGKLKDAIMLNLYVYILQNISIYMNQ